MDLNSNQEAVVGRSFCNPVPMDIVQSWLKGEYLVGQSEAAGYEVCIRDRTTPLFALDHDNLDPNRPIGMEDAYALSLIHI